MSKVWNILKAINSAFDYPDYEPARKPEVIRKDTGATVVKIGAREYPVDPNAIAYSVGAGNVPARAYYDVYEMRIARFQRGYRFIPVHPGWKNWVEELNESTYRYPRTARF